MKNRFFNALALGAITTFSLVAAQSCNKDVEDLKTRVTVLEGLTRDMEKDIQAAVVTGATIVNAQKNADGVWTLNLSDGKEIVITPAAGGASGGSAVTIEETAAAIVITIDGTAYSIPKTASAAVNSLVFCPEYADGKIILGNDGAVAKFLATPALSAEQVAAATFEIADARELMTRAGSDLIKVESAAIDGDLLALALKGRSVVAGKSYTVAVKATVGGTAISSNYFTVAVTDDFSFVSETLVEPEMKSEVTLTALDGELAGYHRALIPNSALVFAQGFNLKDYYQNLPAGNVTFQLAPRELQNDNVQNHYDAIKEALSADGTWKIKSRLGTDAWNSEGKNGIIIFTLADDIVVNKIFWQIDNPVPGMGLDKFLGEGFPDGQHIEIGTEESVNSKRMIPAGAGTYDLAKIFLSATFPEGELLPEDIYLRHGNANKALQMIQEAAMADSEGNDILYADSDKFVMGELLTALCAHSRGLVWRCTQPSWASSIRENWSEEAKAACNGPANGEILGGWDGGGDIPGIMGWDINEKGLVTNDKYEGWAFRSGIGMFIEYEYGEQTIGPWHWFYVWFNRRVAPDGEGVGIDPDAR